jgi:hypothetical protein
LDPKRSKEQVLLTALGQNAKHSLRAKVFCFASNNRHRSVGSAGPFGARRRHREPNEARRHNPSSGIRTLK